MFRESEVRFTNPHSFESPDQPAPSGRLTRSSGDSLQRRLPGDIRMIAIHPAEIKIQGASRREGIFCEKSSITALAVYTPLIVGSSPFH